MWGRAGLFKSAERNPDTLWAPIRTRSVLKPGRFVFSECASHYRGGLFLITQQFSLRVPDLQAVSVDYVMIWTQGLGGLKRQFEGLKRLHGMATVSCYAKRSVQAMTLSGFSEKFAWHPAFLSLALR
jgi:hypothetical protein